MDHLYCDYDENLSQNAFFRHMQSEHKLIVDTAPLENWVLCIPRAATITAAQLACPDFLLAHVLVPHDELPQTHFTNLLGVDLRLAGKRLTSRGASSPSSPTGSSTPSSTSSLSSAASSSAAAAAAAADPPPEVIESYVLFEEVFYTIQLMKYKVWCIESALQPASETREAGAAAAVGEGSGDREPVGILVVRNVRDAVDIIWKETRSNVIFRRIDAACAAFKQRPVLVATPDKADKAPGDPVETVETVAALYAATEALYGQCLRLLMQNRRLQEKCRQDVHIYRIVRIALETYMMNVVYERVLDGISRALHEESVAFNRTVRRLSDLSVAFFGVSAKHLDVVASVRAEMLRIEESSTAIEKLACLRRSINATSSHGGGARPTLTVDDLIPILAFVIIKSGLAHWTATQRFLQQFVFNELAEANDKGADSFLAATLEAAMSYIVGLDENKRNGEIEAAKSRAPPPRQSHFGTQAEFVEYFFEAVRRSDESEVVRLFAGSCAHSSNQITVDEATESEEQQQQQPVETDTASPSHKDTSSPDLIHVAETAATTNSALCHPLCTCSRCAAIVRAQQLTVNTQNAQGVGALHVAAMFGLPRMINVLLALGAHVDLTDANGWTALHLAAQRGHQSSVLLLLHAGCDVNARSDGDLCTALHLAALHGHEGCAKAILYAAEQRRQHVDKNCLTRAGDTAVHLAARWGYAGIVAVLLEYGVRVDTPNRAGQTASESAHNSGVRELLQNTFVVVDRRTAADWQEVETVDGGGVVAPFRGCISEQLMLGDSGLAASAASSSAENDKVIAAIRNGDTRLAFWFLGHEETEADRQLAAAGDSVELDACHPVCECAKCSRPAASQVAAVPHINGVNGEGLTMLQVAAAQRGMAAMVRFLLQAGASLRMRTATMQSALHLAVVAGDVGNVRQLLRVAGEYELNVQDADGNTALHLAVSGAAEPVVRLLLRHEPWLEARNNAGQRAVDVARAGYMFEVARILEAAEEGSAMERVE